MKESTKILIGVGLGAVLGGMAGYYMQSEEGKKLQKKAKKKARKIAQQLQDQKEALAEQMDGLTRQAKEKVSAISGALKNGIETSQSIAEETAESITSNFEEGVAKAERAIKNESEKIRKAAGKATS